MWREFFPIFDEKPDVAFLDSAASAQKPKAVLEAMAKVQEEHYANVHRGLYAFSQETTTAYEAARSKIAAFMNAAESEVIFTKNATESINLVAATWGAQNIQAGDEIVLTELEHHANIVPWQMLAERVGAVIKVAKIEDDGSLPVKNVLREMSNKTKLVACTALSNALGTVVDVAAICAAARARGVVTFVDASQKIVHGGIDIEVLGADFVVWTGHKLFGPTGVGVLWGQADILAAMPPYMGGGDMIERVSFSGTTYAEAPAKFEAGTPNIVGVIGLGAAVDFVTGFDAQKVAAYEAELFAELKAALTGISGVTCYTPAHQAAAISFVLEGINTHDAAVILDKCGVACRTGHHCAMPLMARLGVDGTIRASVAPYNTKQDIQKLVKAIEKSIKLLT